ncbi:hypothetical protein B0I35DRAFT_413048 [Stachybotrys elegans]|uniref:Uncharacterized protein n=1 Tax=Stachybotrys elegans TaxID=80388 RepID=A0A8K0WNF5_9HYPO|nr:hypothetical protein B0I35DRAFT_413048 [Stachybotrys elegans]
MKPTLVCEKYCFLCKILTNGRTTSGRGLHPASTTTAIADTNTENDAALWFHVVAPPEIQTSLDKRRIPLVFNCNDESEEAQANCMSEDSNCNHIQTSGTISNAQGLGKYAIAIDMTPSKSDAAISHSEHGQKRGLSHEPTVYDLTFDYNYASMP